MGFGSAVNIEKMEGMQRRGTIDVKRRQDPSSFSEGQRRSFPPVQGFLGKFTLTFIRHLW